MNLEQTQSNKKKITQEDEFLMDDFDFRPITSGLGFHQATTSEIKPAFPTERIAHSVPNANSMTIPKSIPKKEMSVYQNDLSLFYGQTQTSSEVEVFPQEKKSEKVYRLATSTQRILAYFLDLFMLIAVLSLVLTLMARSIHIDLVETWINYPHEITPLVITLFVGFYLIYFSVFDKSMGSTLGKNLVGIRVVGCDNKSLGFNSLVMRTFVTILNFLSLGLFSYFDLHNKLTNSKVIKVD